MKKIRLDQYLYNNGFFDSREKARKAVMAGDVLIDNFPADKPGKQIEETLEKEKITIKKPLYPYVSRGGLKLEKGIEIFDFDPKEKIIYDIGASTGGFTDCLLQNGAKKVYSIDVGYGQLDYKIRTDPRVVVLERTNFRYLDPSEVEEKAEATVMDVSFISITKLLEKIKEVSKERAQGVWLIKPQFEAGREKVGKRGVVRDRKVHREVLRDTLTEIRNHGFTVLGLDVSPIKGPNGNIEFLVYTENTEDKSDQDFSYLIEEVLKKADSEIG